MKGGVTSWVGIPESGVKQLENNEVQEEPPEVVHPTNIPEVPQIRVSGRSNKGIPAQRLTYKVEVDKLREPETWEEMLTLSPRKQHQWTAAAEEEMKSLFDHDMWELAELPPGQKAVSSKWVFKAKRDGAGKVYMHKARFVARGFSQRYGEDYDKTCAPGVKH